jgi:hypothetical protein
MSTGPGGGPGGAGGPGGVGGPGAPSEEDLRAAYEAEIKKVRIEHILLEHVVAMVNLGMRRTGLSPGTEDERDAGQVRLAIESIRALMPLLEETAPDQAGQVQSALSQLQLAFVRIGGQPGATPAAAQGGAGPGAGGEASRGGAEGSRGGAEAPGQQPPGGAQPPRPGEPGPAQRSGRLWVPGQ